MLCRIHVTNIVFGVIGTLSYGGCCREMHGHKFATSALNVSDVKKLYVHGEHHYTLVTKIFYSYISSLTSGVVAAVQQGGGSNPEFSDRCIPLGEMYFKFWKPQIRLFVSNFGSQKWKEISS